MGIPFGIYCGVVFRYYYLTPRHNSSNDALEVPLPTAARNGRRGQLDAKRSSIISIFLRILCTIIVVLLPIWILSKATKSFPATVDTPIRKMIVGCALPSFWIGFGMFSGISATLISNNTAR